MRFLMFTLYAPMAAFGEIAVGERRMSWARPARSAILGLVAAAQGIERSDSAGHQELEAGLHYAVRTDSPGRPLMDYQTTQTSKARKGRSFATRREELETDDPNTVLSRREWRSDACFTVALWSRSSEWGDLNAIAEALYRPSFALYLGRKSAPLGLPMYPEIVEAEDFISAFDARQPNDEEKKILKNLGTEQAATQEIAFDHDAPGAPSEYRIERRRDAVISRERWQFADRLEGIATIETGVA